MSRGLIPASTSWLNRSNRRQMSSCTHPAKYLGFNFCTNGSSRRRASTREASSWGAVRGWDCWVELGEATEVFAAEVFVAVFDPLECVVGEPLVDEEDSARFEDFCEGRPDGRDALGAGLFGGGGPEPVFDADDVFRVVAVPFADSFFDGVDNAPTFGVPTVERGDAEAFTDDPVRGALARVVWAFIAREARDDVVVFMRSGHGSPPARGLHWGSWPRAWRRGSCCA